MIGRVLSKYLWVALAATTMSTATFAYLYKEALQDVARVEAEARAEAAAAANERWSQVTESLSTRHEARVAELELRLEQANEVARDAAAREEQTSQRLADYVTSMPDTEWSRTPLPSDVVARLEELIQ